ncbi:phospholipase D-like domain-containing protein [Singulisphaera acidiphila]|uniref:Phosphatidylserine/phosphatidylglycerophosphate/ cardiolipin synthase n=1 Tax=Singulisphaera acidiphila (strain ATCC BAA-1392 / DSM 18658 / VKM B-2454 / MOB10) TaxID=886293 RepID=L0DFM3_SINAD|nr:phospholipase D-like domain-containing protein [Singulisphaera acidiphila]AGA28179.1 phosphatidylserine/phosphatidylglycerophosphate/cardiolipin synthase [Singulisphaera acidiphila DSM 18658]
MLDPHASLVPVLLTIVDIVVSVFASVHVILFKRDTRSAIGWIGLIWLSPILGTVVYVLLGINRIKRRAQYMRRGSGQLVAHAVGPYLPDILDPIPVLEGSPLDSLVQLGDRVTQWPLLAGNAFAILDGGDQAYPAMLRAIDGATRSVGLCTYIFDNDRTGQLFVDALARAVARGVEVRVLIDGVGAQHSWRSVVRALRMVKVPAVEFHPTLVPVWMPYFNLRNHRKLLVVDGTIGFTGGMNILEEYHWAMRPHAPKRDLHFQVRGPAVAYLQQVFADDWAFCTREILEGDRWFLPIEEAGDVLARGVIDGPDDDRDNLLNVILGGLACAKSAVAIATPYFLPDARLVSALEVAALRGVQVDILLPSANNHKLVQWAATAQLGPLVEVGCRVWSAPPPFDHTKLMIVDRSWAFIGSANLDPRSLRLNFEFNLECYGTEFATCLHQVFQDRLRDAVPVTSEALNARSLPVKLRDGAARLLSPYL